MNNIQKSILTLLHYNVIVRDTLEYALSKPEYNLDFYRFKKRGVLLEIEQSTPLKIFLEKAGENGQKLLARIREFYDLVYGDDSTIIRVAPEGLRIDHAQHLTIYEHVIPLHEEIRRITSVHIDFARKNDQYDDRLEQLVKTDERFYRALVFMTLMNDLETLYFDFNKARNEAKGQITPQSNFIQNDISKVVSLLSFSRQNATATDRRYTAILDEVFAVIENINGKRDLPQDKTFPDIFASVKEHIAGFVRETELVWRQHYDPLIKELIADAKNASKPKEEGDKSNEA